MLRVGLLGAGRIGHVHAKAIAGHAGSTLAAVSDVNAEAAATLAAEHGAQARTTEAILADAAIDAVLIATSTDTHSALIEAATAAGKAVLCEKPVDPAPPPLSYIKVSGGLFRDMMIHDFDMAMWVMGAVPAKVSAVGTSIVDPAIGAAGDVDTAVVTLHFADGRIAVIKNSRRAVYGYDQRLELLGSEGLLQAQNMLENTVVKSTVAGVTGAKPTYFFLERYMPAYAAEWHAFVQAVTAGAALPVTLQDGINALALAEAATQSARTGETVAVTRDMLGG